jgi:hypothetical protein
MKTENYTRLFAALAIIVLFCMLTGLVAFAQEVSATATQP